MHREVALRFYDAWNRDGVAGVRALYHPQIEWHDPPELPDAAVHRGSEAVARAAQGYVDAVGHYRQEVVEMLDAPGAVVAVLRLRGAGSSSAAAFEGIVVQVLEAQDGLVRRARHFLDRDAALRAAGLG